MRLLLFINSLRSGGAERVMAKLANYWVSQGHEVLLVTLNPIAADHYELEEKVERCSLQAGEVSANLFVAVKANITRVWRLRRCIIDWQPACVVAFMSTANMLAHLACLRTAVPVVMSERSHPPNFPMKPPRPWLQQKIYPRAASLVVLTQASAQWCRAQLGCENIAIIPNAVSLPLNATEPHKHPDHFVSGESLLVLSVGRLDAGKQMAHVIKAFDVARRNLDANSHLVIVGRGPLREELQQLTAELNLTEAVSFVTTVGNMQDWYERAEIYISASRLEGYPNVLLEAMACGCATIAYDCPTGPSEILVDGKNGFLVPLNDENQLAERLSMVLQDNTLRARLAADAREVIVSHSDAKFFASWDHLLDKVAS